MRECDWNKLLPQIRHPDTKMSRILMKDNETSLLESIKNDSIFGFAVCSVRSPKNQIDEFEKVRCCIALVFDAFITHVQRVFLSFFRIRSCFHQIFKGLL